MVGRAVVVGDADHARRGCDGLVSRRGHLVRRGLARDLRVVFPSRGDPIRASHILHAAQKLAVHRVVLSAPDVLVAVDEALPLALELQVRIERAGDRRAVPETRRVDVVRVRRAGAADGPVVSQPEPGNEQVVGRAPDVRLDPVQPFRGDRDIGAPDVRAGLVIDTPQLRDLQRVQPRAVRGAGDDRVDAVEAPRLRVVEEELEKRPGALRVHQRPPRELPPVVRYRHLRCARGPAGRGHAPAFAVADVQQLHLVELVLRREATLRHGRALEPGAVHGHDRAAAHAALGGGQPRDTRRFLEVLADAVAALRERAARGQQARREKHREPADDASGHAGRSHC
mmetsp:Transcript_13159/g.55269  ORF Transcript_13159/g.55269 Transcript_13159/m.55269 type:complete len:341 (+) Transcript_13159:3581-4603(+)